MRLRLIRPVKTTLRMLTALTDPLAFDSIVPSLGPKPRLNLAGTAERPRILFLHLTDQLCFLRMPITYACIVRNRIGGCVVPMQSNQIRPLISVCIRSRQVIFQHEETIVSVRVIGKTATRSSVPGAGNNLSFVILVVIGFTVQIPVYNLWN